MSDQSSLQSFKPSHDLTVDPETPADPFSPAPVDPSFPSSISRAFTDLAVIEATRNISWYSNEALATKAPYNSIAKMATLNSSQNVSSEVRKTAIICTIGPKTNSVEALVALRKAGMNILRMNFSHGSYEYHGSVIANLRKSYDAWPGPQIAIALDTKGPEIRTGKMANGDVKLLVGNKITVHTNREWFEKGDVDNVFFDYQNITKIIEVGGLVYIDDGLIKLQVESINGEDMVCNILSNGVLSDTKGVNLPGAPVDLPSVSEKDKKDLQWGVQQGVDIVFASFIRSGEAIKEIRSILGETGQRIQIIAKIENQQGLDNFDEILHETDGVMVARGDLGIEIPVEKVFIAQKMMISKCNIVGKPVICATQMLESMTFNPRPTRAEVSDVANAVLDGSDCVMLSGETAKGSYPNESVSTMANICMEAEAAFNHTQHYRQILEIHPDVLQAADTLASSAVNAAFSRELAAIVVFSVSGRTARLVSKYRPNCPIICVTTDPTTARQAHLARGVFPVLVEDDYAPNEESWLEFTERKLLEAVAHCKRPANEGGRELLNDGDRLVIVQGWTGGKGQSNTLRLVSI
jgi:pyruvate kinase